MISNQGARIQLVIRDKIKNPRKVNTIKKSENNISLLISGIHEM